MNVILPRAKYRPAAPTTRTSNAVDCSELFARDLWRHDQYWGTEGSTSSDHARMPPLRLRILRKPALRRKPTASAERFPLRQWATISLEESSSWTRRGNSPSGIKWPLRLQI